MMGVGGSLVGARVGGGHIADKIWGIANDCKIVVKLASGTANTPFGSLAQRTISGFVSSVSFNPTVRIRVSGKLAVASSTAWSVKLTNRMQSGFVILYGEQVALFGAPS